MSGRRWYRMGNAYYDAETNKQIPGPYDAPYKRPFSALRWLLSWPWW